MSWTGWPRIPVQPGRSRTDRQTCGGCGPAAALPADTDPWHQCRAGISDQSFPRTTGTPRRGERASAHRPVFVAGDDDRSAVPGSPLSAGPIANPNGTITTLIAAGKAAGLFPGHHSLRHADPGPGALPQAPQSIGTNSHARAAENAMAQCADSRPSTWPVSATRRWRAGARRGPGGDGRRSGAGLCRRSGPDRAVSAGPAGAASR
jgi:hypothetical protein